MNYYNNKNVRSYFLNEDKTKVTDKSKYSYYELIISKDTAELLEVRKHYSKDTHISWHKNTKSKHFDEFENIVKEISLADWTYLNTLEKILEKGEVKEDRTGVQTISIFGNQDRYDLSKGFPLLTTKKISLNNIVSELMWFINGDTNIKYLLEYNNHIWTDWAFEKYVNSEDYNGKIEKNTNLNFVEQSLYQSEKKLFEERILKDNNFAIKYGDLGPVYGKQWRDFNGKDQLKELVEEIKRNPNSRRLVLSAWNPVDIPNMALAPCHVLIQFYVNDNKLSCQLYQRSMDFPLGCPYNIASYALLTHLIALECNLELGEFIHTSGDTHIYSNQIDKIKVQLERLPYKAPEIRINNFSSIFDVKPEDVELVNYESHEFIKFPIAI